MIVIDDGIDTDIKCTGMKRLHSDLIDEANKRVKKAEHGRAVACKERAMLIKEMAEAAEQIIDLQSKLATTEAEAKELGNKCAASKIYD